MKEHILAEFTNELRDIAIKYKDTQQLRDIISTCVHKYIKKNKDWYTIWKNKEEV